MVAFVKWFISSLNASYSRRVPKGEWEKKPYNPVLGEQYMMKWGDVAGCGETDVLVEQVSHHPPITGFYITNKQNGISLNGHTGQKTRFSGTSLLVDQVGQSVVTLHNRNNERYMFSCPSVTVNGIWYAAPYVELAGTSYIQSTSGLYCTIEYSARGWVTGAKNRFKCYVRRNGENPKNYICKMEGQWSGKSTITQHGAKHSEPFLDVAQLTPAPMIVKDISEQGEMESRKIWQKVSEAIRANDSTLAGVEKSKLENQKREEKAAREAAGQTWEPNYFSWNAEEPTVVELQHKLTEEVKNKYSPATSGNWVFKGAL
ncbi:hypothetical protein BDF20DRAFT_827578 [Mycotypha africana]|uniref:uncharacterized protein n=1 Tax=Mycotypha africana TaxID=64632 RepID=UPI002301108B|nr:uncharacterized protein BDF20DRAFT_827578 [Mycotypha africana]KAI8968893.1 hypothetical protein BDF20DRAFT_827578 [Mycotypha africana]